MDATATAIATPARTQPDAGVREFLSFRLGAEEYGIDILKVQEIRGWEEPTRMAGVPGFVKGVINLRGIIVPIIDLRMKFNLASAAYDTFTVVIIVNVAGRVLGLVVDSVSDVVMLSPEQIKPAPEFSALGDASCITELGAIGERMLILMDIEALVTQGELGLSVAAALQ